MEAINDAKALIESTINSVRSVKDKYESLSEDTELGETFHEAGKGLDLIGEALDTAQHYDAQAVTSWLQSCKNTAGKLEIVFKDLIPKEPGNARRKNYVDLIESKGRSNLVEALVVKMMDYVCKILKNNKAKDMQDHLKNLEDAVKNLKEMEPSVPIEQRGSGYSFANYGTEQYNATDNARQFKDAVFNGGTIFN